MGRLFGDFTIEEPYAVQNTEVTRRGALLAVAASAALSIGAWAEPIRPRLIDEIGEATFTSLSRFRPGRDGVERLSVSVQTVDEQQRPVKFLLPNGVQSEIFYEENGEQRAVEFVVPAGLRADGRKRRVNTTYLLFQLNPSVEKGAVRIQHGNRYTDMTTDAAGRYTHLTYGVIQGQKVYSPDDGDCD